MCSGKCNLYAMIKRIMFLRDGLDLGGVRAPLANLFPEDLTIAEQVAKMIDRATAAHIDCR